jgi:hypothetical protein
LGVEATKETAAHQPESDETETRVVFANEVFDHLGLST